MNQVHYYRRAANLINTVSLPTPSLRQLSSFRHFSSSSQRSNPRQNRRSHYEELGISKNASKKEIKIKFHELSKQWHPDAPSSSSSTRESRTARFQALSESYSVLSDDSLRRQYDQSLSGSGSSGPRRPTYTSGTRNEAGTGSGFGGNAGAAWSTENSQRRDRANYAWAHPTNNRSGRRGESASEQAEARKDPFANRGTTADHSFAAREARFRHRHSNLGKGRQTGAGSGSGSQYNSGTASFGAKAEEESRLINDSSVARSGQVFLTFAGVFVLALMFAKGDKDKKHSPSTPPRRNKSSSSTTSTSA